VDGIERAAAEVDFGDADVLQRLYSVELSKLKGPLSLLEKDGPEYNAMLARLLLDLRRDVCGTAAALSRYVVSERGKLLVVVMDNCDKRARDEQLLMFEVAQWIQSEFRCLVFLPLRDVTYDHHRHEPPLDTAVKDLVFRIEPAQFSRVLHRRVHLVLKEMEEAGDKKFGTLEYDLPNGMRVSYPASDQAMYLTCILKSVFEYDAYIRRLITGLAGRDLRRGMELFLDFCMSGHIGEDTIYMIRKNRGNYRLPFHVASRVLLRQNRRFYAGDDSFVKNVFQCEPEDDLPCHFVRYCILWWLQTRFQERGPTGVKGFHRVSAMASGLSFLGIDESVLLREMLYLVRGGCIVAEHMRLNDIGLDDLVRLSPAGSVHLRLAKDVDYLSACAEDMWFDERELADVIAGRIGRMERQYTRRTSVKNAVSLTTYLSERSDVLTKRAAAYLEANECLAAVSIGEAVAAAEDAAAKFAEKDPWFGLETRYSVGSSFVGRVVKVADYGVIVELEEQVAGLVSSRWLRGHGMPQHEWPKQNEQVRATVKWVDEYDRQIGLELVP